MRHTLVMCVKLARYLVIILCALGLTLLVSRASAGNPYDNCSGPPAAMQHIETSSVSKASTSLGYETLTYTNVDDMQMTYYLFVPNNYNPRQKYPLVLLLHGGGERADPKATLDQNRALLLKQYYTQIWISAEVQQKWPSFVVIPQIPTQARWVNVPASTGSYTLAAQPSSSLCMAKGLVDSLQQSYQGIDASRLYITGLSMGGYGVWEAIERWPNYFAAAAPLAGAGDPTKAELLIHTSIWAFHGARDATIPVSASRDMIRAIIKAGGHPRYTEYPNEGHDLWGAGKVYSPSADAPFFIWLFSQRK